MLEDLEELTGAYDLAESMLYKIERPTGQEEIDQVRDGKPKPIWVLKTRVPTTTPVRYFASTGDLFACLAELFIKQTSATRG